MELPIEEKEMLEKIAKAISFGNHNGYFCWIANLIKVKRKIIQKA